MNSVDKLLIFITAIVLGIFGMVLLACVSGALDNVVSLLTYLTDQAKLETTLIAIVVIILSIYLLSLAVKTRHERSIVKDTTLGNIRISLKAVESLVLRAANQVKGIKDVQPLVAVVGDGLRIQVDAVVIPDVSIPDVATEVQSKVGEYILSSVGVAVSDVRVNVRSLAHDGKARVE